MSDYGITMNVSVVTSGDDDVKLGYKVQDTNGLNLSNKITGTVDEVTEKVKTEFVGGLSAALAAKKKTDEERRKMEACESKAKATPDAPAQSEESGNSLVERLRRLEEQNRQLRQQLEDMKPNDAEKTHKDVEKKMGPKHKSFVALDSDFDKFVYDFMKRRFLDF